MPMRIQMSTGTLLLLLAAPLAAQIAPGRAEHARHVEPAQPVISLSNVLHQPLSDPELTGYALSSSVLEVVPAGVDTVAHRHDSELFGYVLEGAVDVQLEGGPMQRFEAGQMFYEPRNVLHTHLGNPNQNQGARVLILHIIKDGRSGYRPERAGPE